MENKINIAHILKDVPKEIKLYSPILGDCEFDHISEDIIYVKALGTEFLFNEYGHMFTLEIGHTKECVLFPSKDCRTWENFKAPWKHKHFEPYQPVLVQGVVGFGHEVIWLPNLYGFWDSKHEVHRLIYHGADGFDDFAIIPYKGNENKLGKEVE